MALNLLEIACAKFGKRELARKLGMAESSIYAALKNNRLLRPDKMELIENLIHGEALAYTVEGVEPPAVPAETALLIEIMEYLNAEEKIKLICYAEELKKEAQKRVTVKYQSL